MSDHEKVIAIIQDSTDPDQLRRFMENAKRLKADTVYDVAFNRLIDILPEADPGTVEHDFWRTIHSFEQMLLEERGKTVRLSRTRQKITKVGVMKTLNDLALGKKPSEGFEMLMERGLPELTAEAVVLRHTDAFEEKVTAAARERLEGAGVDCDHLAVQ